MCILQDEWNAAKIIIYLYHHHVLSWIFVLIWMQVNHNETAIAIRRDYLIKTDTPSGKQERVL